VVGLLCRDDWSVTRQHEVDTWVWHQVGLELCDIDVQRAIKAEGRRQGRDNLRKEPVQVRVCWSLNVEIATADIVKGLVVQHDGHIGVLEERVDAEHSVVWLDTAVATCGQDQTVKLSFDFLP